MRGGEELPFFVSVEIHGTLPALIAAGSVV